MVKIKDFTLASKMGRAFDPDLLRGSEVYADYNVYALPEIVSNTFKNFLYYCRGGENK